jgi:hypothetical protein
MTSLIKRELIFIFFYKPLFRYLIILASVGINKNGYKMTEYCLLINILKKALYLLLC